MNELKDHLGQVLDWLDTNVIKHPTPSIVALSDFDINWGGMSGYFSLSLDDLVVPAVFSLSLGQNGWMQHHPPMFCSPLGAPASYGAIDLTDQTNATISKALKLIFPRLRPLGLDSESGKLIIGRTPLQDRIFNHLGFEEAKSKISNSAFIYKIQVAGSVYLK